MPKDDINYKFTENGIVYDFYDVFVPAENFRQPSLFVSGVGFGGQLGTNDTTARSTPVTTFAGGTTWKSINGGREHIAAIKTDGTLWNWGRGTEGQLGNNVNANRSTPLTTFAGGNNWKSVACGREHTVAIKTDGSLWTWGFGNFVALGINNTNNRNTPVTTFAGGTDWKSVACGERFTAAIKTDGSLWTWGLNNFAQLGVNDGANRSTPVTTFAGGTNWKQVSCGNENISAIKSDGSLWTWGKNDNGQLGINNTTNRSTPVTTFAGENNWKRVACGRDCTVAIKTDGSLWTWGGNAQGQLGINNNNTNKSTPVTTFAGGTNWKSIGASGESTLAIKTDGSLWVWGRNGEGQLGINNITNSILTPVTTFAGGNNWKSVGVCGISGTPMTAAIKYSPDP
jgi:alpha-tubulin suppressor-like RCC1 family protein